MALYNDLAPSTAQYSSKAVSIIFLTTSGDSDRESSPPRLYKASEQIARFSSNVKGTNGSTVVIRDNIEGYGKSCELALTLSMKCRTPSCLETFGLKSDIRLMYSSLEISCSGLLRDSRCWKTRSWPMFDVPSHMTFRTSI